MDKTVGVFKSGWHPQRKEGRSIRGEIGGLVGRGKKDAPSSANHRSADHVSRPLTSLQDPDAFGPPPKNANFHGADKGSVRAPVRRSTQTWEQGAGVKTPPPPVPYRSNTTGLNTAGLLPPPKPTNTVSSAVDAPDLKPKPQLPPRLPPRQNSQPETSPGSPPPAYTEATQSPNATNGFMNHRAVGRLAQSGISVPGFGIGQSAPETKAIESAPATRDIPNQNPHAQPSSSPINGLRSQFSSLSTSHTASPSQATATPSTGTTWAQKQAALSTASRFQKDPSKVNADDARAAFSTANNFRQRHGEEVAKGFSIGQDMNKKYGLADKAQNLAGATDQRQANQVTEEGADQTANAVQGNRWGAQASGIASGVGFKKAPPPPPPTRRTTDSLSTSKSPPPIPVSSKPR